MRIDPGTEQEKVELNLTPMIDVVFLLIIFFMVATKFAEIERNPRVNPPTSRHARPATTLPQKLVVNVTSDGTFIVLEERYRIDELDTLIASAVAGNPEQTVVVRGDRQTPLQFAVDVIDLCERHNVKWRHLAVAVPGG